MIHTTAQGSFRVIRLDRPHRRNALTRDGLASLRTVLKEATEPVVYLTGAGNAFCAGADFDVVSDLDAEDAETFIRLGQSATRTIANYDGVVVAGVDGPARGGGVELALACDVRAGTKAATFAETGVSLGLFGAWGGTARLPRIVGEGNALDLSLSGRVLDATEAKRMGLLSRIVDDPRTVAEELLEHDHQALRVIKERIRDTSPLSDQEDREVEAFRSLIDSFEIG